MVFSNPGCGKTSIARLLAKLLYDLGAVSGPKFIEVQRTDLVGSHIGTTGPKTRAKIDEAKGGILFIDEAYRLTSTSEKDFGTEALEEIMSDMTTGDPLIIAAGYPEDMRCASSTPTRVLSVALDILSNSQTLLFRRWLLCSFKR